MTEAREDSGGVVGFVGLRAAALHPQPAALAAGGAVISTPPIMFCDIHEWNIEKGV